LPEKRLEKLPQSNHPFRDSPVFEGYQQYGAIITLPISLSNFNHLFLANDSPYSLGQFNRDRHSTNKTLVKGVWSSPVEDDEYAVFQGMTCKKEMKTRLQTYGSIIYPAVKTNVRLVLCGETETSLVVWNISKAEDIPLSTRGYFHEVTEIQSTGEGSVDLRTTAKWVWNSRPWGMIAYTAESRFSSEMTKTTELRLKWYK
jgi:hypothetical protein